MSYQKESFGMMDEGYFVPRGEIIDWINNILDLNMTKIQQLGAGSIYCQIVDVIHPGKVTMSKVNWKAKSEYEFINNLKILQTAFDKAGVKRYVDVQKLAKAKYQDNLQFIQWLKRYYDLNCGDRGNDYNARERRANAVVDLSFAEKNVVPKSFNGGGQQIPKTQLPGMKAPQVVVQKGPALEKKPQRPKVQQKRQMKSPQREIKREANKAGTVKLQKASKDGKNWEELYKKEAQKNHDLNVKFSMLQQVLISNEDTALKIAMIQEIMNIVRKKEGLKNENQKMEIEGDQHYNEDHGQQHYANEEDEII